MLRGATKREITGRTLGIFREETNMVLCRGLNEGYDKKMQKKGIEEW